MREKQNVSSVPFSERDQSQPNPHPHPGCDNCDGTGWVEWTNKRGELHGQVCHMCELLWSNGSNQDDAPASRPSSG